MKNRLTRIKSPISKRIRNTSPFRYIIRNKSPPNIPTKFKFSVYKAEHIPPQIYNAEHIPPKYPPPPNVNIADQIPLQVKIRNTRFRSDFVGKFQR